MTIKILRTVPLLVIALGPTGCTRPKPDGELASRIDAYLSEAVPESGFQGSISVALSGSVLFSASYGMANLEHQVPNTLRTRFRIGSVTKQMTATGLLILQDQGRLDVEDRVLEYLPDLPPTWAGITIHQMLTHTSGLPDLTDLPNWKERVSSPSTLGEEAFWYWEEPLLFQPGQEFRYSNAGYELAGLIIERVSGAPYEAFLQETVFEPLGLLETGFDRRDRIIPNMAQGYFIEESEKRPAPEFHEASGGSTYSTVGDMIRWGHALSTGELLSQAALEGLTTPEVRTDSTGTITAYASGLFVREINGTRTLSHGGWVPGYNAFVLVAPEKEICVVALSNVTYTAFSPPAISARIANEVASIVLE
ncbi:MAG: beta-lactamase family protein [Gemmatimonadetes bacterium]|nr:beta-lactamase family protein [Gemmatimonadota bacterium]NNM06323.1 beta-lactamase family protein [Gemmatimonadota bacterium]